MNLSFGTSYEAVDWVRTALATIAYVSAIHIAETAQPLSLSTIEGARQPENKSEFWFTINLYLPYDSQIGSHTAEVLSLLSPLQRVGLIGEPQQTIVDQQPAEQSEANQLEAEQSELDSLAPHRVGQRFVILPLGRSYPSQHSSDIPLRLGTSFAFGSGFHPATVLSLQLLEKYVTSTMNVLDFGSGSGILSVAIAKLGARVVAIDNDPVAVQATQDAVVQNQVDQQVTVLAGSLGSGRDLGHWLGSQEIVGRSAIAPDTTFDLIVANIFARIHILLAPDFQQVLRQSESAPGVLITAGYTKDYEEDVKQALEQVGLELIDGGRQNEWVALVHRRIY
jgi:ribosomal protein L11 methyltransferase